MSNALRIPVSSAEYLKISVTANVSLTSQPVHVAIVAARDRPDPGDWQAAAWAGNAGTTRTAQLMIGPGTANVLTLGEYDIWARVTDTPEIPTDPAGRLTIY